MKKIFIVAFKEYLTRVKRRIFWILSLLIPLFLIGLVVVPAYIEQKQAHKIPTIVLVDSSSTFSQLFGFEQFFNFIPATENLDSLKRHLKDSSYEAILIIPKNYYRQNPVLFSNKPMDQRKINILQNILQSIITQKVLAQNNIPSEIINQIQKPVKIENLLIQGKGKNASFLIIGIAITGGVLIYFFIFMYGSQIMNSVKEEKRSRIVEILLSCVRPSELLTGKIIGISMVAFTQFIFWIVLSVVGLFFFKQFFVANQTFVQDLNIIFAAAKDIKILWFIILFFIYFILGYLIYSLLFAAIAAAVDNDYDMQQFILPTTLPLVLAMALVNVWIQNPDGVLARWFSLIPFTSPVTMTIRLAYGVPTMVSWFELISSIFLLILTFIFSAWFAGKIYRIGILVYGQKITYRDLFKWLVSKD